MGFQTDGPEAVCFLVLGHTARLWTSLSVPRLPLILPGCSLPVSADDTNTVSPEQLGDSWGSWRPPRVWHRSACNTNHPPGQRSEPGPPAPQAGLSLNAYLFTEPQEADGIGLSPEAARAIHTAGPGNDKYGLGPGGGVICVSIVGGSRYDLCVHSGWWHGPCVHLGG